MTVGKTRRNTKATVTTAKVTTAALAAAGLGGVTWVMTVARTEQAEPPAACVAARPTDPPGYAALCAALNRPDLPALLGTPKDRVSIAQPAPFALGTAMAEVRLGTYVVALTESSTTIEEIAGTPRYLPHSVTLLDHPAQTYSTDAMTFGSDARGKAGFGIGSRVEHLIAAQDHGIPGGRTFEIAVFRNDGRPVDDATVRHVAEAVLPTLPGWSVTPPTSPGN
ncbi:DUF6215 domain-containing protein [Kitasatospora purpeofusca]|uniref:DUF6215 domain-containing protein n=1 Tax=Kitasatospora purpeofusca TaxID=67352 RepID=UPI0012FF0857|nr:DUF6215 domain-containing protein [Kitasatospora purpeofusca]